MVLHKTHILQENMKYIECDRFVSKPGRHFKYKKETSTKMYTPF